MDDAAVSPRGRRKIFESNPNEVGSMDSEMMLQSPETKLPGKLSQHSTFFARLAELILEWPLPTQILDKEPLVVVQHRPFQHSSKGPEEMADNILGDSA
jgi:hypothetical protein